MTIGATIRNIRKMYGITQKRLSEACGIDASTIRKYESGKLNPKPATLEKIARGLGVDVNVLLESELNASKAMIRLFSVFTAYSGNIMSGEQIATSVRNGTFDADMVYISFESLNALMNSWLFRYEKYKQELEEARLIEDVDERDRWISKAEKSFHNWMSSYPMCGHDDSTKRRM